MGDPPVIFGDSPKTHAHSALAVAVPALSFRVSKKSAHIASRINDFHGQSLPAHYLGFFDCFNRGLYYEAHDVLEEMWLPDRKGPDGDFYKSLIQLAGAFVHVQKNRPGPAVALLNLTQANLDKYPSQHHGLDLSAVTSLIARWRKRLDGTSSTEGLFQEMSPPHLALEQDSGG